MTSRINNQLLPYKERVHLLRMFREMLSPKYNAMIPARMKVEFKMDSPPRGDDGRFISVAPGDKISAM